MTREKLSYNIEEATAATGLSRRTFYRLFERGDLRPRKCGKRTVILADDLAAFLNTLPQALLDDGEVRY